MKYFTKKWCFVELKDKEVDSIYEKYQKYISEIYLKLPVTLKILVKDLLLHDGLIKKIIYFKNQRKIEIEGIFGDFIIQIISVPISALAENPPNYYFCGLGVSHQPNSLVPS